MARKFAAVVFSLGCVQASSVWALGLGELSLESFLNEPLKARVDLLNTAGLHEDEIRIRLATKEDFDKLGLERAYFLTSITFTVESDDSGQARIVMTSEDPVLEPYLDFIIEARWPSGRLLREYTVLVDPPVFDQASPVISASERVAEVEGLPAPAKKKEQAGSTGTQVKVKKSDLAPGQMPQRDYNADTAGRPMAGSRYMIKRDDTLWEVARQARPEGVSVHQTMLDIQRLNPEAFINGNINQVKAGYIVYLPSADDISSADLAAALAEVRQQNEDWREGRASTPAASSGPSLRISAEPEPGAGTGTETAASSGTPAAAMEDLERAELDRAELEQRLVAMRQQVETLQNIVSVKDEQIAALQGELATAATEGAAQEPVTGEVSELVGEPVEDAEDAIVTEELEAAAVEETEAAAEAVAESPEELAAEQPAAEEAVAKPVEKPAAKPAEKPAAKPKPAKVEAEKPGPEADDGMMSYLLYGVGALLLAILGFIFMRRRGAQEDELEFTSEPESASADVEDSAGEPQAEEAFETEADEELEQVETALQEEAELDKDNRGYGEHKHDEYASDIDEVDALAEADIYIAYGRYPQAIDLLKNAINSEPSNPTFRLKLLELHADMGDADSAREQFAELQRIDDPGSLARAESLLAGIGAAAPYDGELEPAADSTVSPLDLIPEGDEPLKANFSGLEIEDTSPEGDGESEELDLSVDFADSELDSEVLDEDLVIAAESNGLSTKLDLARAYLDMGDDDGARQILEEVASEGKDELKAEALELLERIG